MRLPETELGTLSIEALNKKCKISTVKACLQAHVFFMQILFVKAKYMQEKNINLEASVYGGVLFSSKVFSLKMTLISY